jgi:hypothetical protein
MRVPLVLMDMCGTFVGVVSRSDLRLREIDA